MIADLALVAIPEAVAMPRSAESPPAAARVCFPFAGDSVGGSHLSVLGLIAHLDPVRYRAIVVPEVPDGRIATVFADVERLADPLGRPPGFVPGEAFGTAKFLRALRGTRARMRFLKENRFDIVHVNDGRTSAGWALAAKLAGIPLVWHHRGDPGALGLRLAAPLLANRVLAVSSFALPAKGIWSAADKADIVHSPFDVTLVVDRAAARARLLRELDAPPATIIIGFFGAFVPRKRPLQFVDALARLAHRTTAPVIGVMFGEARVAAMADALADRIDSAGMSDRIRLMGYRTPGAFWIGACDQLIVPAVGEPFGRTLIEAMLVGTPVIAARSGGNVEALQGGLGLLVEPDDPDATAAASIALIADPDRAADIARRAGTSARERFSETRHRDKVTAAYDRLLQDKPMSARPSARN